MIPTLPRPLPELETKRLILRPMTIADAPMVVRWRNSAHVTAMSQESTNSDLTIEQHLRWFTTSRNQRLDYIVLEKAAQKPIGSVSFTWVELSQCSPCAESGRYIGEPNALGNGYGLEAARGWLTFGFEILNLKCVVARTKVENIKNLRINRRLNYQAVAWPSEFGPDAPGFVFMCLRSEDWFSRQD
jgi:RimJ/RimL family protein N-acetyltransferase